MGERICVLKEGVVQQVDTPIAIYNQPANAYVAGFIGSPEMNIYSGQLQAQGDGLAVRLGELSLPLPPAKAGRDRHAQSNKQWRRHPGWWRDAR